MDQMVDKKLISREIFYLRGYLDTLGAAEDISWTKYIKNLRSQAFVERYMHLCIEKVIDIGNYLVSCHQWRVPDGNSDLFMVLHENGVLPEDDLSTFQDMAAFREMLVHRYEKMDEETIYGIFAKRLGDFVLFISLVTGWVDKNS